MVTIVVVSVALLSPGAESVKPFGKVTEAVLVRMPWADAVTVPRSVNVARPPPPDRVTVLLTLPEPLPEAQLDPAVVAQLHVTLVTFEGSTSDTTMPPTVAELLFVTTMV